MALVSEKGGDRRRKREEGPDIETPDTQSSQSNMRKTNPEVGNALRSAYQQTVNEDIPPEMLDLLGKLG